MASQPNISPVIDYSAPALRRDNRGADALHSFIFILLTNTGDLTDSTLHTTYDKKSFIRLFIHSRYNKMYPPVYNERPTAFYLPDFAGPGDTAYYVFALRKIII